MNRSQKKINLRRVFSTIRFINNTNFSYLCSGVGQSGVPDGLITRRSVVQIYPPLLFFVVIFSNNCAAEHFFPANAAS